MTRARKNQKRLSKNRHRLSSEFTAPFIAHVHELRKRLMYIALSVGLFGAAAYAVEHHIVDILLQPAQGQKFIYTSPGGGIDFLFRLCLYVGIIASIPVIIYQLLRYIEPLVKKESVHFIAWGSVISGVLAIAGVLYGYFLGLPAALHFLLHQFVTQQIQPLVTIQSYLAFVMVYMVGSSLLFQIPLVLIFINRIKPLKPQGFLKYERHVIVVAVILAALMNPTPNVFALLLLAGPIILMYQIGILIILYTNRKVTRPAQVTELLQQDMAAREKRAARATQLQPAHPLARQVSVASAAHPSPAQTIPVRGRPPLARRPVSTTSRKTFSDFTVVRQKPQTPPILGQQSQNPA